MATQINREEQKLDISSLIDVVFLLIMFFVVTADLDRESYDERVKLAECKFLKPEKKSIPKSITVNILEDGRFTINRKVVNDVKLINSLKKAMDIHGDNLSIIVRLDKDANYEHTNTLKEIIQDVGLSKVRLVSRKK